MAVILKESLLADVDHAKERIDSRRLDDFVRLMHDDVIKRVVEHAHEFDEDNEDRKLEVVGNFRNAWSYAIQHYQSQVDTLYLQNIAGILEPKMCGEGRDYSQLRQGLVKLESNGGYHVPPADRERIIRSLNNLSSAVERSGMHPLEEAVFYKFHLIRIQPFDNANKRLGNIVMNTILHENGLFPINFTGEERYLCKQYLAGAISGFKKVSATCNNESEAYLIPEAEQAQLFDFMGRKELTQLREAEDILYGLPSYYVQLNVRDKSVLYTTKRKISSWFERHGMQYQQRLNANARQMEIVGEIPLNVLTHILEEVRGIEKFRISEDKKN